MPERLQYVDAAGAVLELSDLPGVRALGDSGLEMPPVAMIEDTVPGQPGAQLRDVRIGVRETVLPFYLTDDTDLRGLLRTLAQRMNPQSGDGTLRHIAEDGTSRDLTCRYTGGLEGDRVRGKAGPTWRRGALMFRAHDPFWYDTDPATTTYTTGTASTFLGTFLPIHLASDTVLGEQTVTNDGDVETWPVWTIAGPATSITLSNVTTGEAITLPITLTAGQSVTIDTRPFRKTVRRDDGTNLYGNLAAGSALWSLPQGASTVNVQVAGSTASTFVTLVYYRRYLSP